ncbi:MAG: CCA tRNA nucleotidyltransferase [Anaerotardibacter sp.]
MDRNIPHTTRYAAADQLIGGCVSCPEKTFIPLPKYTQEVLDALEDEGYESWVIGGYVRDYLLGEISPDVDIATAAHWQEAKNLLKKAGFIVKETGIKHGTITALRDSFSCEITTFRKESVYGDYRHPDSVLFVETIEEDIYRRDFTINTLAYHPDRGLLDLCGGLDDLQEKKIRCVGKSEDRFREDPLRIMRALRFCAQTGFSLKEETEASAHSLKEMLNLIAPERIQVEFTKMLCGSYIEPVLNAYVDILGIIIPELCDMKGFSQQNRWHHLDMLEHTARSVSFAKPLPLNRWAALFHDIGKPETFTLDAKSIGHMTGHPSRGAAIAKQNALKLRFSKKMTHDLELLVLHHETRPIPTKKAIRKLYNKLENDEVLFRTMLDLMTADAKAHAPWCVEEIVERLNSIEALFEVMLEEEAVFSVKDLPIKGDDLLALGIPQGPQIGNVLHELLEEVYKEHIPCERMALLEYAKRFRPHFFD